ncbi:hypothetical protein O4J56_20910 [Nocardiopsis sp. RSe5-2]|uniref:DUF4386 family protein n=1 Tax=Nocardiopsis endophytica TaxID=3018445 RepID=A0ABT4U843_9ACTN|nr:hypothetical protein [Nocardiopsis endophytica]MDA2813120.1 hypothetical protein [Nocardiopsis endophytica]
MELTVLAGAAGIAFVAAAIGVNAAYMRIGVPLPTSGKDPDQATAGFAATGAAMRLPSVVAPLLWLCTTLFAAGLLSALWRPGTDQGTWALVGFSGVLLQNAAFACVEALRFGMAEAARHGRGPVSGLWGTSNVLFGFNQVFLAMAVLGFTAAGVGAGLVPVWHAVLGYASAALLFASSLAAPYRSDGIDRLGGVGLVGWLGWAAWIVAYSAVLFGL